MCNNLSRWIMTLLLLIVATVINTALVDELVSLMDNNLPIVKVSLEKKLGWELNMAATAFSLLAVLR